MAPKRETPTAQPRRKAAAGGGRAASGGTRAAIDGRRAAIDGGRAGQRDGHPHGQVTEIQRARMIAAMIDTISERGRSGANVAHVVSRSGVSRRTFYEVFEDFEDCFLAALDQSIARAGEYVREAYEPGAKWSVRIRAALIAILEFLEDEPAMGRLCVLETLGAGRKVHERRLRALEPVIAAVEEGRRETRSAAALPPLTGEGVVGGVLSVLHARLLEGDTRLLDLTGPLMGMIALPYLGPTAAYRESSRVAPKRRKRALPASKDPLRDLQMRLTYRTVRVLMAISANPGSSNREVGAGAGIDDQGQISKLLSRLDKLGLVENRGAGQIRGAPNAWSLTKKGFEVEQLIGGESPAGLAS
jgi:AcrR family transcriptional regulator